MHEQLSTVRIGLAIALLGLLFGIGLGVCFGVNEEGVKTFIAEGVAANPEVHDAKSMDKIWRYAQRAHFHATGVAAFSLALIAFVMLSGMSRKYKVLSSALVGLGNFYSLSWFTMFLLAPTLGRDPAHEHLLTEFFVYLGVGSLLIGMFILVANLFLGLFADNDATA